MIFHNSDHIHLLQKKHQKATKTILKITDCKKISWWVKALGSVEVVKSLKSL